MHLWIHSGLFFLVIIVLIVWCPLVITHHLLCGKIESTIVLLVPHFYCTYQASFRKSQKLFWLRRNSIFISSILLNFFLAVEKRGFGFWKRSYDFLYPWRGNSILKLFFFSEVAHLMCWQILIQVSRITTFNLTKKCNN